MSRFILFIVMAVFVMMPSWGRFANLRYADDIEWNATSRTKVLLQCDTTGSDTTWTIKLQGWVSDGYQLLLKTGDGKVIDLKPFDAKFDHITDSIGHSSVTGELIEFYHYEQIIYYHISTAALDHIAEHGISKIRCGTDTYHRDVEYKRNEFGKELTKAYKKILEEMSPDYVPPRKPTIYDDF